MANKVEGILEEIKGLTLLEAADLVKKMEETFGVSAAAAAPVMMAGGGAGGGGGAARGHEGLCLRGPTPGPAQKKRVTRGPGRSPLGSEEPTAPGCARPQTL